MVTPLYKYQFNLNTQDKTFDVINAVQFFYERKNMASINLLILTQILFFTFRGCAASTASATEVDDLQCFVGGECIDSLHLDSVRDVEEVDIEFLLTDAALETWSYLPSRSR